MSERASPSAPSSTSPSLAFLDGGGEASRLILARDWTGHPLGAPQDWPEGLKTALSLVLNSPESMILAWGQDDLTFFFNETYFPLLGPRLDWAMGAPFIEVWADGWEQAKPIIDDAFAGNSPRFVDLPWTLATDRGVRDTWWSFSYSRVLDTAGAIAGLFIFTNETTARVLADRAAEEGSRRLALEIGRQRLSLQQMPGFVAIFAEPEHRCEYVNDAFAAMAGARDYVGHVIRDIFPDLAGQDFFEKLDHAYRTGQPYIGKAIPIQLWDEQSDRFVDVSYQPIRDDAGTVTGIFVGGYEVTEAVRAQRRREALDALELRFRDVADPAELSFAASELLGHTLNAGRVGYGAIDPDARTITVECDWALPGFGTLAGVNSFDDYGTIFDDLQRGIPLIVTDVDTDPRTAPARESFYAIDNRAFVDVVVLENGRPAGQIFVHSPRARTWLPEEVALIQDFAERTRAAIARREAERDLRTYAATLEQRVVERTHDLEEAHERLRQSQKMEAVGQLTGGVAHDFNNLLTVIRGSVDLLRRPNITEERRTRYLDAIGDTAERATKLTGQLLAFARRQALNPEAFDVRDRVAAILDMLRSVTGGLVKIDTHLGTLPCIVRADANQFETALINIAVNAKDAMPDGGTLTITVECGLPMPVVRGHGGAPGPFVAVTLVDTGSGIAPDIGDRVFEPFFTTKVVGKGTGLGLSQVFGFAKQSGGNVVIASDVDRGAAITLYLPEAEGGVVIEQASIDTTPAADGDGLNILVVEDNIEVGRFSTQVLDDLGYRTSWAASAEEALQILGADGAGFDAVFSDIVMAGMGGIKLAKHLAQALPEMPVLLASGYSEVLAQEGPQGFELLQKPYSADQLSQALRRATNRSQRNGSGV